MGGASADSSPQNDLLRLKSRVTNILSKLGASDRAHAVTIALKRGIIDIESPKSMNVV
jgi:hypothetical protein